MRKSFLYKMLLLFLIVIILCIIGEIYIEINSDPTVGSITKGAYTIESFHSRRYDLWNKEENKIVVFNVIDYRIIKSLKKIYLISGNTFLNKSIKYSICDYDKVKCDSYQMLDDMSEQDRMIFEMKDEFQSPIYIDISEEPTIKSITKGLYTIETFAFKRYALWNTEKNTSAVVNIERYRIIESVKKIYLIGEGEHIDEDFKYFVCDYDKVKCNYYKMLDDMSEQDRIIFEEKNKFQFPNDYS